MEPEKPGSLVVAVLVQVVWLLLGAWALIYGLEHGALFWIVLGAGSLLGTIWSLVWMVRHGRTTWW